MGLLSLLQYGQLAPSAWTQLAGLQQPGAPAAAAQPSTPQDWTAFNQSTAQPPPSVTPQPQPRRMQPFQPAQMPQQQALSPAGTSPLASLNGAPMAQINPPSLMERINGLSDNGAFQIGLSLLGNAQNGGDWRQVGQDMQAFNARRQQQQRLANEERRQAATDRRQETVFGWSEEDRQRQVTERQAMQDWIATLPADQQAEARANPDAAYEAYMQARAAANAPITPYQQAQLDLQRRGQNMDYAIQSARVRMDRPLRGPDASLMQSVREAADRSQALSQLGGMFIEQNGRTGTGPDRNFNPFNNFDTGYQTMNSLVSQMIPFMRTPGSGATSDYEQRLYQQGVQSPTNSPTANQAIYRNQQTLAELSQQRRYFYEEYASRNGTLNGAEQAFQASPEFQRIRRGNPLEDNNRRREGQRQSSNSDPLGLRQ